MLVGIFVERSPEMVVGLLAVLKAGGAYVPLDVRYPRDRLAFMLEDAQVRVVLTPTRLRERLPLRHRAHVICLDGDADTAFVKTNFDGGVCPENLAYLIYTSGSTGKPKGVMVPHRGLVNYLSWCIRRYQVVRGDGALVHSSIAFALTITGLVAPCCRRGRCNLSRRMRASKPSSRRGGGHAT